MTASKSLSITCRLTAVWLAIGLSLPALAAEPETDSAFVISAERWLNAAGPCLVAHNQGVDAIAEYRSAAGERLLWAGSWLGRDGRYLLPPPSPGDTVTLQLTTGETIAPGQVALQSCPPELPGAARDALVQAQDLRLATYFGAPLDGDGVEQAYARALDGLSAAWSSAPALLSILGLTHYEAAAYLRAASRLAEAYDQYGLAAAAFDELDDAPALAAAVNGQGLVAWRQGELDQAVVHFEQSLTIRQALGDLHGVATIANNLGLIHARKGELAAAVAWYEIALGVFQGAADLRRPLQGNDWHAHNQPPEADARAALNTLGNLALVLRQRGQVDLAEQYWRNYLALEAHIASPVVLARARLNFAQLLSTRGRLDEALWQLTVALGHFEQADERRWRVEALTELAMLYQVLGDPAGALAHAREAVAIELEDVAAMAEAHHQLGRLLLFQGEDADAAVALERSVVLARQADSTNRQLRVESDLTRARFLANPSPALLAEQRELHARFVAMGRPAEAAAALSVAGEMQFLLDDPEGARNTLEQAIAGHRAFEDPVAEFHSLALLGRVLGQHDAMAAIETNHRAIELAEGLRYSALPTLRQAELFASLHRVYRQQVRLLVEADRFDAARALAELARGDRSWEPANSHDRNERADLLETRSDLLDRMHRARLDQGRTADSAATVSRLTALQRELDGVETALAASGQHRLPPTLLEAPARTPARLDADTVLLSYLLLDDLILLWITSSDGTRLEQLDRPEALAADIAALQDWLRHPRRAMGWIHAQAGRLGQTLLAPAAADLAGKSRVLVQADDMLHGLPFGLLHWSDPDAGQPLIETHIVGMVTSRNGRSNQPGAGLSSTSLLLVADPGWADDQGVVAMLPEHSLLAGLLRDDGLAELPGSRLEAEAIARRAAEHMPVRLRTGPEASREFILDGGLNNVGIIHLATHGLVDLQYPMLSSLLLASEHAAGPAFLRPSEIADLRLNADLVVLSGCETGRGRIVPGSGALSLARPFLAAGADQVLASLWKIDDARTARFMDRFYQHLLDDSLSPDEALARAQRWTRRQPDTLHPYYWAGFILLSAN